MSITDKIPANTTYVQNSLSFGGLGLAGACVLNGTVEDDNTTGADESDLYGGSFDGTNVTGTIASLLPNVTVTAAFQVTVTGRRWHGIRRLREIYRQHARFEAGDHLWESG